MKFYTRWKVILLLAIIVGLGLACWQPASAGPPEGWIINLGTLDGHNFSNPRAINERGWVVGASGLREPGASITYRRAFLRLGGFATAGTLIDLGSLSSGGQSEAVAINDMGEISGWATVGSEARAFLIVPLYDDAGEPTTWVLDENGDGANDLMQDLGLVSDGEFQTIALGINQAGNVVGGKTRAFPGQIGQAFLNFGGEGADYPENYRMLGTLGGAYAYGYGINEAQWVVGGAQTADGEEHAYVIEPLTNDDGIPINWGDVDPDTGVNPLMIDLGTLGGTYSHTDDINDSNYMVGRAETGEDLDENDELDRHAFLYNLDSMTSLLDLGTLGGVYSYARALNGGGYVVGASHDGQDFVEDDEGSLVPVNHAFLLTPADTDDDTEPDQWVSLNPDTGANDLMYDLNNLRDGLESMDSTFWGTLLSATNINNAGYLVGRGQIADGYERAFIFMPVGDDSQGVEEKAEINVKSAIVKFNRWRPDKGLIRVNTEFDAGELALDENPDISMTFNDIELFAANLSSFRKCRNNYILVRWGYYVRLNFVKKKAMVIRWRVDLGGLSPDPDTVVDVTLSFDDVEGAQQITMQPDRRGRKLVYVNK